MSKEKKIVAAIDAEIEALDEIIKLKTMKLELLRTARHSLLSDPAVSATEISGGSASLYDSLSPSDTVNMLYNIQEVLTEVKEVQGPYALDSMKMVTSKVAYLNSKNKRTKIRSIDLLLALDTTGTMHIYNVPEGVELGTVSLEHNSTIVATAFDGSEKVSYFVSSDRNGYVHVTSFEIVHRPVLAPGVEATEDGSVSDYFVDAKVQSRYNINIPPTSEQHESKQAGTSSQVYGTAVFILSKAINGKVRGIYTGDSDGSLQLHSIEGELQSHVSITPLQRISGIQKSRMNMIISSGNVISILQSPQKLKKLPLTCLGPKENIVEMTIDSKHVAIVYAKLASGELVVFNTRHKEPKQSISFSPISMFSKKTNDYMCKIVRIVPPVTQVSQLEDSGLLGISKSHVLAVDNSTLRIFDRSQLKKSERGSRYLFTELYYNLTSKDTTIKNKKSAPLCVAFDKGIRVAIKDEEIAKNSGGFFSFGSKSVQTPSFFTVGINSINDKGDVRSTLKIYQIFAHDVPTEESSSSFSSKLLKMLGQGPLVLIVFVGLYFLKNKFGKIMNRKKDSRSFRDERSGSRGINNFKSRTSKFRDSDEYAFTPGTRGIDIPDITDPIFDSIEEIDLKTENIAEALKNLDFDLDLRGKSSDASTSGAEKTDTVDRVLASTIHSDIFDADL